MPSVVNFKGFQPENSTNLSKIQTSSSVPEIKLNNLPQINYTALNNSWYNPKIAMLIVSPNITTFIQALQPLKNWENEKGVKTVIASNFSKYEGRDKAERIRNMIKQYYKKDGIRWVLLAGDAKESLIPTRYVYNPDTVVVGGNSESVGDRYFKPTDYYYAALKGSWDQDNDSIFGESKKYNANGVDEISWTPDVYVGRFPADTAQQLEIMVNKTINYEKSPDVGTWMNNMLLAGAVSDLASQEPPDGEDEARLTQYIWKNYVLDNMNFTQLYRTTSFSPETPPPPNNEGILTESSFDSNVNSGYSTILFAGHGNPDYYEGKIAGTIYSSSDAQKSNNTNMPSLFYADACTTAPYDLESYNDNIGETLMRQQNAGAIAYIGAMRVTWYFTNDYSLEKLNRGNAKLFWYEFFHNKEFQPGKALYDSKVAYMNSEYFQTQTSITEESQRKNLLTYNLLGDPEVDIYTNTPVHVKNTLPNKFYE
ncbi:MAG: C25 family cysteine peptidase, partial [Candidatus Lokiarchaeota archaeon]